MVQMREIADEDFILLEADQDVAQAVAAVQQLGVTAVVVRRWQGERADYHLYLAQEFLGRLAGAAGGQPLADTLRLQQALRLDLANTTPSPLPTANRSVNLQRAIQAYYEALRFTTPDAAPLAYAVIQTDLGKAYAALPTGDRSANLQRAIQAYYEALRFLTPEAAPLEYADTQTNLGKAYAALPTGDRSANLQQALRCFQQALRFLTPVVGADEDAESAPLQCIITDGDQVLGFYDVRVEPTSTKRGAGHRAPPATMPVARALQTTFPEQVALGQSASLLVSLVKLVRPAEGRMALPLAVPLGSEVEILVEAQRGFVLEGSDKGSLTVLDEDEMLPLKFELRATEVGPGRIRVLSFQHGQPLGAITLSPTVVPADHILPHGRASSRQELGPFTDTQPDLTLRIFERSDVGRRTITLELKARDPSLGLEWKPYGPFELRLDPLQYFQEFFKDIEGLRFKTAEGRAIATRQLELEGARLFEELVPAELRVLLWSLRERIDTLQVLSDEPWIPWELLRLVGQDERGQTVEGPFLCEAFAMTRWFPGIGRHPTLRLKRLALVIPTNSGLPFASHEREYLRALVPPLRKVVDIPARFHDVVGALSTGTYDGWHFCGHGVSGKERPDASAIVLEDSRLRAGQLCGELRNCGQTRPLVFLNACQTGQAALSLTGIGGWAKRFVDAGAAAFVGSLWSVRDRAAAEFAGAFYGHLLAGQPIGQAVRVAREAIRHHNDTTWLAYTVFADPLATVQS